MNQNPSSPSTANRIQLINKAKYLGYKLRIEDDYTVVTPLDRESYTAEVYKSPYGGTWGVMTTSYGVSSPETIDLVIDGLKRAQEMVNLLTDAGL